ncbi:MAG: glycosyltransferase [Bacillota bacterium]|nr:glycosyltransferase [Bacillota bacterium]
MQSDKLRVCMLTKFPPIEGGISSRSYWLARGFAEHGLTVHVVTNAMSVEDDYRIAGCESHLSSLEGVTIHSTRDVPWHIPFAQAYAERLLNLSLRLIESGELDIIDTGFLHPYGTVGYLAHCLTGIPYVVRHGGSDLAKFLNHPEFSQLLHEVIAHASLVLTDPQHLSYFQQLNERTSALPPYVPDCRFFRPAQREPGAVPAIAFFGKINYYWRHKQLLELIEAVATRFTKFRLVFYSQGRGLDDFRGSLTTLGQDIELRPFVPPWKMPDEMGQADYVLVAQDTAIPSFSNIEAEARAMGKEIIALTPLPMEHSREYGYIEWVRDNIRLLKNHVDSR